MDAFPCTFYLLISGILAGVPPGLNGSVFIFQHESAHKAFEDAQKQMNDISEKIKSKTAAIKSVQNELEKNKVEASDARKAEEVCFLSNFLSFVVLVYMLGIWITCVYLFMLAGLES